jgi:hypothetical protein
MNDAESLTWMLTVVAFVVTAIWLAVRSVRWAKKGTKGGAMLVALAFPNPDQPPPQQQVEEQTRRRKDSEPGESPE